MEGWPKIQLLLCDECLWILGGLAELFQDLPGLRKLRSKFDVTLDFYNSFCGESTRHRITCLGMQVGIFLVYWYHVTVETQDL